MNCVYFTITKWWHKISKMRVKLQILCHKSYFFTNLTDISTIAPSHDDEHEYGEDYACCSVDYCRFEWLCARLEHEKR